MFSIIKIALIGSCLLGTAGNQALQSQVMHQAGPAAQLTDNINVDEYIGEDKALEIALKDAGVKEKDTTYLYVHLDHDDGAEIYEVEFMVDNKEYDYDIDANSGKILSKDFDIEDIGVVTTEGAVTKDQAKEIAVKDAGFSVKDVTFKKVKQEFDDGIEKIKVEFIMGDTEYEYDIDAKTGKILEFSSDSVYDD